MIILSSGIERNGALVNDQGQLLVLSTQEPEDKTVNRRGAAWTVPVAVTPAATNDYFFYFENTGTATYTFTHLRAFSAAATTISVRRVVGTPSYTAATDIDPVNRNLGFTRGMAAIIKQDTDTTGLTSQGELYYLRLNTADQNEILAPTSEVIIPPGAKLAFLSTVSTAITATVSLAELV